MKRKNVRAEGDGTAYLLSDKDGLTQDETKQCMRDRVVSICDFLCKGIYGKKDVVKLALLSALSRESIFLLGPPGTAKSMISRRIVRAFDDVDEKSEYFEYLMNEFSTPDEICGPVSLKLLEQDKYHRLTKNYLPTAKVAFLDEIWKSGPAILNTLLTIVNEKVYHNGCEIEHVLLLTLVAASNELPAKGKGLEALWDRFLMRVMVNPTESRTDFFRIIEGGDDSTNLISEDDNSELFSASEVEELRRRASSVTIPAEVKSAIMAIREDMALRNKQEEVDEDEKWYVSDRRWKKIACMMKMSAFLNGRNSVTISDLVLARFCIWNTVRQESQVDEVMEKALAKACKRQVGKGDNGDKEGESIESIEKSLSEYEKSIKDNLNVLVPQSQASAYKPVAPVQTVASGSNQLGSQFQIAGSNTIDLKTLQNVLPQIVSITPESIVSRFQHESLPIGNSLGLNDVIAFAGPSGNVIYMLASDFTKIVERLYDYEYKNITDRSKYNGVTNLPWKSCCFKDYSLSPNELFYKNQKGKLAEQKFYGRSFKNQYYGPVKYDSSYPGNAPSVLDMILDKDCKYQTTFDIGGVYLTAIPKGGASNGVSAPNQSMQQEDASVDKLVRSLNEQHDSIDGRISGLEACLRKELDAKASAVETENCFLDASGVRIICAAVNGQLDKLETLKVDLKHKRSMYRALLKTSESDFACAFQP